MDDIYSETSYGQVALQKLSPVAEGFMIYECGWLGKKIEEMDVMEVKGAVFREAKKGINKGKRTVMVKGSNRTTYVARAEIDAIKTNTRAEE